MSEGRVVGLDFGTRRVGVAIADPLEMFAQPVGTFDQDGAEQGFTAIDGVRPIREVFNDLRETFQSVVTSMATTTS